MKEFKKEYDRRDDLKKQVAKETERLHIIRCKLNNWDRGLIHAQKHFDAFKKDYDETVIRLQKAEKMYIDNIAKLEGKHKASARKTIADAHPNQVQCEYCKRWFKDIARHECKKIPEEILQAREEEKKAKQKAKEDAKEQKRLEKEAKKDAERKAKEEAARKKQEEEDLIRIAKALEEDQKELDRQEKERVEAAEAKAEAERLEKAKQAIEQERSESTESIPEPIIDSSNETYFVESAHTDLEQAKAISEQIGIVKEEINGIISDIEWIEINHPEWMVDYANDNEGKKAIWQGRITDGFRTWCESQGYKIGD